MWPPVATAPPSTAAAGAQQPLTGWSCSCLPWSGAHRRCSPDSGLRTSLASATTCYRRAHWRVRSRFRTWCTSAAAAARTRRHIKASEAQRRRGASVKPVCRHHPVRAALMPPRRLRSPQTYMQTTCHVRQRDPVKPSPRIRHHASCRGATPGAQMAFAAPQHMTLRQSTVVLPSSQLPSFSASASTLRWPLLGQVASRSRI